MDEDHDLMLDAAMNSRSINSVTDDAEPTMPEWSSYRGQPVDVSRRRSIVIRDFSSEFSAVNVECVTVDYFLHESTFWTAVIPLTGVSKVYGQAFNFSAVKTRKNSDGREVVLNRQGLPRRTIPILNHVQSRFQFQTGTGIRLYPLYDDVLSDPVAVVDDLVYSLEVTGPPGVKFNMNDGLRGNLLSAHRILSTQEMVFERLVVENQTVTESPGLPLNEAEKRALLFESLCRSHRAGMMEPYYLYRICGTNNCTSSPLQILDQVVEYSLLQRMGSMLYRLPLNPRFYLRVRGLDASPKQRKLVRTEFAGYIEHPDTQARKRDYVIRLNAARKALHRQLESDDRTQRAT